MKASVGIIKKLITVSAICFVLLALAACGEEPNAKFKNANVGDYITFGSYEQDNNTANGKEAIEWLVLAKDGDKALVISRYSLDCQNYNSSYEETTWEKCSLRNWLNESFLNAAFNTEEQKSIQITTVTADGNLSYDTPSGNDTEDKIFLLSVTEANKLFKSDESRMCFPTEYAITQGAKLSDDLVSDKTSGYPWWLRTPGYSADYTSIVGVSGTIVDYGSNVSFNVVGDPAVRPAMWINFGLE